VISGFVMMSSDAAVANCDMSRFVPSAGIYAVTADAAFFAAHRDFAR
jgi:hypothetical protein